jgi:hypothetical protein
MSSGHIEAAGASARRRCRKTILRGLGIAALPFPALPRVIGLHGGLDRGALVKAGDAEAGLHADYAEIFRTRRPSVHQALAQGRGRNDDFLASLRQGFDQILNTLFCLRHRRLRVRIENEQQDRRSAQSF